MTAVTLCRLLFRIRINIKLSNMIENTASDFSEYIKVDMANQLAPIENSIDDMLMRLEEFESMVLLVQQERGNVMGLTGTLSKVSDKIDEIDALCTKIDVMESLIHKVRDTLDSLEEQIEILEEQPAYSDSTSIRNFFMPKMFKKTSENKTNANKGPVTTFKTDDYFVSTDTSGTEETEEK